MRSIYHVGMGELIIPYLKEIAKLKNNNWDNGLINLRHTLKYEKRTMADQVFTETNELIASLTKNDFISRYKDLYAHLDIDDYHSGYGMKEVMAKLADEFCDTGVVWEEAFPVLYKLNQGYAFYFGMRLWERMKSNSDLVKQFIDKSIEFLLSIEKDQRNVTVLGGFVSESSDDTKKSFYSTLFNSEELNCILFYFISIDKTGKKYFDLLFQLVDNGSCELSSFYTFEYSNAINEFSIEELSILSQKFYEYGDEGYAIVFNLFFDIGYRDDKKEELLIPIYKQCIYKLGVVKKQTRQLESFKWNQAVLMIIKQKKESEFAQFINDSIINLAGSELSYSQDRELQNVYEVLLNVHFESIWPSLSKALLSKEKKYLTFFSLKQILGSHIGGVGRTMGVLFTADIESIFQWCESNKPLAPIRLAELVPIFDDNNTNIQRWHPLALRLINLYGNIREVLGGLNANMGTFSSVGSVVPFLEAKKKLFITLIDHPIELVRTWATSSISSLEKQIEREKNSDAEFFMS